MFLLQNVSVSFSRLFHKTPTLYSSHVRWCTSSPAPKVKLKLQSKNRPKQEPEKKKYTVIGYGTLGAIAWFCYSYFTPSLFTSQMTKYAADCITDLPEDSETRQLINEVYTDLEPVTSVDEGIRFCLCPNMVPYTYHRTSPWYKIIVLPWTFSENSQANIETILSAQESQLCLLSKNAKKYLLARDIVQIKVGDKLQYYKIGLGVVFFGSMGWKSYYFILNKISIFITEKFMNKAILSYPNLHEKTKWVTRTLVKFYALPIMFILCMCIYFGKKRQSTYEADKVAASLGEDYVNGGLEYYSKCMEYDKYQQYMNNVRCFEDYKYRYNHLAKLRISQSRMNLEMEYKYLPLFLLDDNQD